MFTKRQSGEPGVYWVLSLSGNCCELLEVPYCHVVFTLPAPLSPLALQNPRVVYNLLFQAVAETLQTIARDPKHLGAEIGFLEVLRTWGQTLHLTFRTLFSGSRMVYEEGSLAKRGMVL